MGNVVVQIMAHPARAEFIPQLQDTLDRDSAVTWDRIGSRWDTGRRAMLDGLARTGDRDGPPASHVMILQDDAVIPPDLVAAVEHGLRRVPGNSIVSCYIGNQKKFWGRVRSHGWRIPDGTCWITMGQLHWGVATVWPADLIEAAVTFGDRLDGVDNWDRRLSRWCEATGTHVWHPWPSLVSHREHTPSLVPGRQSWGRYAQRFIGDEADSALAHDPSGPAVWLPKFTH